MVAMAANEEGVAVVLLVDKDEPNTEDAEVFLRAVVSSTTAVAATVAAGVISSLLLWLFGSATTSCGGVLLAKVRFELSKKLSSSVSSESDAAPRAF